VAWLENQLPPNTGSSGRSACGVAPLSQTVRRMNPTLLFLNRHMLWKARGSNIPSFVRLICKAGYPPRR